LGFITNCVGPEKVRVIGGGMCRCLRGKLIVGSQYQDEPRFKMVSILFLEGGCFRARRKLLSFGPPPRGRAMEERNVKEVGQNRKGWAQNIP